MFYTRSDEEISREQLEKASDKIMEYLWNRIGCYYDYGDKQCTDEGTASYLALYMSHSGYMRSSRPENLATELDKKIIFESHISYKSKKEDRTRRFICERYMINGKTMCSIE